MLSWSQDAEGGTVMLFGLLGMFVVVSLLWAAISGTLALTMRHSARRRFPH